MDPPTARELPQIPLQHLRVEYETPEHLPMLLEDALAAFGETLCTVRFECRSSLATLAASKTASERDIDDPSFRHGPEIQLGGGGGGGGWHCPNLTSLHILARGMIHWEDIMGSILLECPCLEVLEVVDDTPKYSLLSSSSSTTTSTNISSSTRAWSLPSLRRLVLKGYPAVTFSPRSLSSMGAQLTSLELYGAGWLGDERRFFIPPASETRRAKMEAWRRPRQKLLQEKKNNDTRWWWHLPNLQSLKLVGECALWFPVETVLAQGACPRLRTLTLDIGGHRFPSLIGGGACQQEKEQDMEEREEEEEREDRDTEEIGHCHNRQKDAQDTSATTLAAAPPSCLTSLSLIGAWEVTDATLNRLLLMPDSGSDSGSGSGGGLCPKLEALVLHQARHYTNAGLVVIAEQHPTLERVVTSRYLRGRDAKRAGLELLPWSGVGRSKGTGADGHEHATEYQGPPPTVADLAQITGQKDLRCIIYQMDTFYYRRTTTTW
ncbi:hypothetical protein DFQ26_001436 [Actinomortierella ambigua]|nr:hypothetical protein DFQ26_001436 [Actinomortierella ambigua]